MLIEVRRSPSTDGCTLGKMFVDGAFECFTLEDVVREVPGEPVSTWKVQNQTAIPFGTYDVIVTRSLHFGKDLPLLLNVPGFDGVRIHSGNTAADTEGCILVGETEGASQISASRAAFGVLFPKIQAAVARGEKVEINIIEDRAERETSVA